MAGYTKLFSSIVTSTIWCEDYPTRLVWVAMLAMSDANGVVEGSVPGFASLSRVTIDEMRAAVQKLSSPDPDSRTVDHDGRRIEQIDGGWVILNYKKYREQGQGKDGSRAPYMREYRKNHNHVNMLHGVTRNTEAEAEAEAEESTSKSKACVHKPDTALQKTQDDNSQDQLQGVQDAQEGPLSVKSGQGHHETKSGHSRAVSKRFVKPTPEEVEAYASEIGFSRPKLGPAFCDYYEAGGWKIGNKPMKNWKAAVRTWKHRDDQGGSNGTGPRSGAEPIPGKYANL